MKSFRIAVFVACSLVAAGHLQAGAKADYKIGKGLSIESDDGNNRVELATRVQPRFTYLLVDNDLPDTDTFEIRRTEIKLTGFVLNPKVKFGFQMDLGTRAAATTTTIDDKKVITKDTSTGFATLAEAYLDWVPRDVIGVQVGQFKVPFLKQQLTSAGSQQFIDRSISTGDFDLERDIGINVHGTLFPHMRYGVFVMNGAGVNNFNVNQGMMVGTRLEFPIMGNYESSEADVKYSEKPDFGVGVAYAYNEFDKAFSTVSAKTKASLATIDAGLKYRGFSIQLAAMTLRTHEGEKQNNLGYMAQVGYFLVPKKFEIAARGASTFFDDAIVNEHEYGAVFNYYIMEHAIKIQADYAYLINDNGVRDQDDHRVRTQLQFTF